MATALDLETRHRLRDMAAGMRILHNAGLDSGVAGHLSMRVQGEDAYWINPWGIFWDEIGPDDFVKMTFELQKVAGSRDLPSLGSGFHAAIYRRREDVNFICHTHAPHIIALAAKGEPLGMYDQRSPMFLGRMGTFEQRTQSRTDGSPFFGVDEGDKMADALGKTNASLLLTHHGAITTGSELATTVIEHLFLEECARTQIWATILGADEMPADVAQAYKRAGQESGRRIPSTWEALVRRLRRTDPDLFIDDYA